MPLLTSTSDIIRVVTDTAATVDVTAWFSDMLTTTNAASFDKQLTAISSATTTTIVAAPAASYVRKVREVTLRNRHASTSVTVTVQVYNGSTAYEWHKTVLGPGAAITFVDGLGWASAPQRVTITRPWHGVVAGAYGEGDPGELMRHVQRAGNIAATPTNIAATVARCSAFVLPADMTVNRIRAFGVGITASIFRVAIYRMSDLARLTAELAFSTAVDTWVSIGTTLGVSLLKDTTYFVACSVNTTGATAGPVCFGGTIAATTGRVNSTPAALPGSLSMPGVMPGFLFQFAVTAGALPNPAATLAAQAAWTGGMPAFWLDSADV